jgi:hypothetical protein
LDAEGLFHFDDPEWQIALRVVVDDNDVCLVPLQSSPESPLSSVIRIGPGAAIVHPDWSVELSSLRGTPESREFLLSSARAIRWSASVQQEARCLELVGRQRDASDLLAHSVVPQQVAELAARLAGNSRTPLERCIGVALLGHSEGVGTDLDLLVQALGSDSSKVVRRAHRSLRSRLGRFPVNIPSYDIDGKPADWAALVQDARSHSASANR